MRAEAEGAENTAGRLQKLRKAKRHNSTLLSASAQVSSQDIASWTTRRVRIRVIAETCRADGPTAWS